MRICTNKIVLILFLFLNIVTGCQNGIFKNNKNEKCVYLIKHYQRFWREDSLGKNGFRLIYATEFLRNCSLESLKWNELSTYLGKPNFTYLYGKEMHYRYRVNYLDDNMATPGTVLLEVFVLNDSIARMFVRYIDG